MQPRSGHDETDTRLDVDYCRVSVDKSGAEAGVGTQHQDNEDFAEEIGVTLDATYTDNDLSAFSGVERPEYERLLVGIAADRVGTLIFWHANRFLRNTDEVNSFIRLARAHQVRVYSSTEGAEYRLERAAGRKELRDDVNEAEYESEHRGERVALARKRQARNGDYGGGVRPYGWGVDSGRVRSVCVNPKAPAMERRYEDRPVLDMTRHNPAEAAEIRRWADDLLAGVPVNQILRDLTARGVPTQAMTDGRSLRRGGKAAVHGGWNSQTIRQILTSPRTSGHVVYKGQIVTRNACEPILHEDIRQALITLFGDPARKTSPGNTPRWLGSLIYQCGVCQDGTTMTVRRNKSGTPVYRCRAAGHCTWPAARVDAHVENLITERLSRPDVTDLLPHEKDVDVAALREELIVCETRKKGAAQMFARRAIDGEQLETITAELDQTITRLRAELSAATAKSPLADFAVTQDARRTWDELTLGRKREVLRHLINVTLPPLGRGHTFNRDLIQIGPATPPGTRAA
ncbi:MAG TPA: recombinase family protein [Streptosporangiaceae bacterium]|nr:recombinase family protein [Streptosporangiaceae bacterium]